MIALQFLLKNTQDSSAADIEQVLELGNMLLRFHHDDIGVYWLYRALKLDPNCRQAHEALAAYYEKQGLPDKAAVHKQRVPKN